MMPNMVDYPFFTIITVCYNAGDRLKKTIDSVCGQSFLRWELIIKDGCSNDGSLNSIDYSDRRIKLIKEKDSGIYNAMNRAIVEAKGSLVLFLNAGDLLVDENVLAKMFDFQLHYRADVYYGNYINSQGDYCVMPEKINLEFMYRSFLCHQSVFYRRENWLFYDEKFKLLADHNLHLSLLVDKKEFVRIPFPICIYEGGGISENPKYQFVYDEEKKKIHNRYYSKKERRINEIKYRLTLPYLRAWMYGEKSPYIVRKLYRKIVAIFGR